MNDPRAPFGKHNGYGFECLEEFERSEIENSFLHIAMRKMWLDIIGDLSSRFLIACAKLAMRYGHAQYFKYIVENYGVDPSIWQFRHDDFNLMRNPVEPLRDICLTGDREVIKFMVDGKRFEVTDECANAACKSGAMEYVCYIVRIARNQFGSSAVDSAAEADHFKVVKFLCEDLQLCVGEQGLGKALSHGHLRIFEYFFMQFPKVVLNSDTLLYLTR
jgi:hypothetical protein